MSHNKIKVAGQEPDASGEISLTSLTIGDLSNVTINSPAADQVIKYDSSSSAYINAAAPAGSAEYILLGQGDSSAYSNSGASNLSQNSYIEIYDTGPLNTISGATVNEGTASDWYDDITLPAGQYFVQCQTRVSFSASGYLLFSLADTSDNANVSAGALIGDNATSYASGVASTIQSHVDLSGTTTIGLKLGQVSNLNDKASQGTNISEYTYLLIVKMG
jgi:hypothetical protein